MGTMGIADTRIAAAHPVSEGENSMLSRRSFVSASIGTIAAVPALALLGCTAPQGSGKAISADQTGHEQITVDLMEMLENDPNLKKLVEKSLAKAWEINPDPATNPAKDLEQLFEFTDWAAKCMPWDAIEGKPGSGIYERIDQSLDAFYFLFDQPLDELKDKGYYYPSLSYHQPIRGWLQNYALAWGSFLASPDSWNDEYYELICSDERFNMASGWYGDENIWTSFNDWFSRKLVDQDASHPVDSDAAVVSPADSTPQGVWHIDQDGMFALEEDGLALKSARFNDIENLLGPDCAYKDSFNGGTFTHMFLDVNDYHRYHFPVSGTILEIEKIPAVDAIGGITIWDPEEGKYVLLDQDPGWQSIETRDRLIIETEDHGLVAIMPIGMSQVCSCNWEPTVQVGAHVEKGEPMGYFLFGGSDICLMFQEGVEVEYLPAPNGDGTYAHILMGQAYCNLG